jgi:Ni2+-binding GTPase involved in maturation of urease and hydrogenase
MSPTGAESESRMSIILQPPSALIMGPSGSGKTASIVTQLIAGLEVFVIVTEPDGVASLLDRVFELKIDHLLDKLHWTTCLPASAGWAGFEQMITSISSSRLSPRRYALLGGS